MSLDLRPLTLAELLDRSFSTYRRHLWLFVGIMAVPAAFAMVTGVLLRLVNTPPPRNMPPADVFRYMLPILLGSFLFGIVYILVYTFALGATTIAVSELFLGREATVASAYRRVRRCAGRLIALFVWGTLRLVGAWIGLVIASAFVGFMLGLVVRFFAVLFLPFALVASFVVVVFMTVRYGVAVPAVVLEGITGSDGLRRSVELTQGNLGRVFLLMLCATMIAYATAAIFQGPFVMASFVAGLGTPTAAALGIAGTILGAIGGMFSGPLMIIGLAMMYYDLRIRKEALDLQLMLENLDAPSEI
jgi:hypothetical protein